MNKSSERKFVERIVRGDETALRLFCGRYTPKLFAFIESRIQNPADAEEILQDTLLAGLEKLRDFEQRSKISTFLCAIARHKIIDYYRKKKVKQVVLSRLPEEVFPLLSSFLGPEEAFDAKQVRRRITLVFEKMKPHYRQILVMKYIDGLSVCEIARILSVTLKSAESRLFRARTAFAKAYDNL